MKPKWQKLASLAQKVCTLWFQFFDAFFASKRYPFKNISDPPSKGASQFSPMGDITVDRKGIAKLLDRLNVHKAPGPDGLNTRELKECSNEISPILALIFNESLARGDVPDEWRQDKLVRFLKR